MIAPRVSHTHGPSTSLDGISVHASLVLLTVVLLAVGCSAAGGEYAPAGIIAVLAGVGVALLAAGSTRLRRRGHLPSYLWPAAACMCAGLNLMPGLMLGDRAVTVMATAVLTGCALALCRGPLNGRRRLAGVVGIGADLALAAVNMQWGRAGIDVFWFTQGATRQLLAGRNPYAASYPTSTHIPPTAHFPFGPGVLLVATPFRLIGDVRAANAAAMIVIILVVAALARRHGGRVHAGRCLALAISLPFVPFMIVNAWPEVYPVAGVALWLLWRDRHPAWSVVALGLGLAAVPTAAPLLALPWLWWRAARREITAAVLFTILLAVPFAIWAGPGRFMADTVGLQLSLGPRPDGLSLNGLLWHLHLGWLPWWAGITASGAFVIFAAIRGRHTWGDALALGSTLTLVALVTAKWAVFNYYFIVAVGFVLALTWLGAPSEPRLPAPAIDSTAERHCQGAVAVQTGKARILANNGTAPAVATSPSPMPDCVQPPPSIGTAVHA